MATVKKDSQDKTTPVKKQPTKLPATITAFEKKARQLQEEKGIKRLSIESLTWFEREVKKNITSATMSKVESFGVAKAPSAGKLNFQPGQLVMYKYDPKWKDELPYYDTLPLGLVVGPAKGGWRMINFHYMPPRIRTWILNKLYENNTRSQIIKRDRVFFSWKIAQAAANAVGSDKHLKHGIKHYLADHVRSKVIVIDPAYWDMVVFLPLARFKKGSPY